MFYQKVNLNSAKDMFEFINGHFTYDTLNSWNNLHSIANNVKLYNLHLKGDWTKAMDLIFCDYGTSDLVFAINDMLEDWENEHPGYSLGFNGRSGGYLVIYNKEYDGRVNCKNILPDSLIGYDNYEDWKYDIKNSWYKENVKDYLPLLKEYTKLIQDFDKLCDDLTELVDEFIA